MDARQESYLQGLSSLIEEVKVGGDDYQWLDILRIRLKENIDATVKGDTRDNQAQRMEILASLNGFTRDRCGLSFDEYCQKCGQRSSHVIPVAKAAKNIITVKDISTATEVNIGENAEQLVSLSDLPLPIEEQTVNLLTNVNKYIAILQKNVQKARDIFNDNTIGREQCKDVLAIFHPFDYHDFPEYNQSLYRAKVRLQRLNEYINDLIGLCEVCGDIDRNARLNVKKIQNLIGTLDSLYYEIGSIQSLLGCVDINYGDLHTGKMHPETPRTRS